MRCLPKVSKIAVALMVALLGACSAREAAHDEIVVAAAADLRFALDELSATFSRQHPQWTVQTSFGSSGVFYSQLQNGAPYDLYLSADVAYPKKLGAEGLIVEGSLFTYAVGRIVLWTRADSEVDAEALGAQALTDPRIKKLAIANPQHAPYGRAAESAMRSLGVYDAVADKLVLGENVSQTLQFVQSGGGGRGYRGPRIGVSAGSAKPRALLGDSARRLPAHGARRSGAAGGEESRGGRGAARLLIVGRRPCDPEALRLLLG